MNKPDDQVFEAKAQISFAEQFLDAAYRIGLYERIETPIRERIRRHEQTNAMSE